MAKKPKTKKPSILSLIIFFFFLIGRFKSPFKKTSFQIRTFYNDLTSSWCQVIH